MQFEYEISPEDYVACQALYYKLTIARERIWKNAAGWSVLGIILILSAWNAPKIDWGPVFLTVIGAYLIYCGARKLFPSRYFRRQYSHARFDGKKFKATVDAKGIQVSGEFVEWNVQWGGLPIRGENARAFMLSSEEAGVIFMFGKRYLTEEQQQELRKLAEFATTS